MSQREAHDAARDARKELSARPAPSTRHEEAIRKELGAAYYQELREEVSEEPTAKAAEKPAKRPVVRKPVVRKQPPAGGGAPTG